MTNFIIGAIFGMVAIFLLLYIMSEIDNKRYKKEFGEEYKIFIMSKSDIEKYEKYMNENNER